MKINFLLAYFLIINLLFPHPIFSQDAEPQSLEKESFTSYGFYEEKGEEFVPTRISYFKLVFFPLLTVGTPITFPAYYIFTKEPKLSQSLSNYWEGIYYKVPYDVESVADEKITFPKKYHVTQAEKDAIYRQKRVKKHLKKGEKYFLKQKYDKALAEYELVLNLESDNTHASAMIEQIKEKQESLKDELEIKEEARERVHIKREIRKILSKAERYYKKEKYEKALSGYNKVLEYDSENKDAKAGIDKIEKIQKAKEEKLRKKREEEKRIRVKEEIENQLERGEKYYQKEEYDKAKMAYEEVLKLDSENGKANTMIENIMKKEKAQQEEAKRRRREEQIKKLLKSGNKYYKKEKYKNALSDFKRVLELDEKNEQALKMIETITEIERLQTIEATIENEKKKMAKAEESEAALKDVERNEKASREDRPNIEAKEGEDARIQSLLYGGREQFKKKKYVEARNLYRQVLKYYPANQEAKDMVKKISGILREQDEKDITSGKDLPAPDSSSGVISDEDTKAAIKGNIIRNGDFEVWSKGVSSAPDFWVQRNRGVTYERVDEKKIGSYGLSLKGAGSVVHLTYQRIKDIENLSGKTLTASCWIKTRGQRVNLRLNDGSITGGKYHTGNGEWELLSVSKTISMVPKHLYFIIAQPRGVQKDEIICDGAVLTEGDEVVEFSPNPSDLSSSKEDIYVPFL